MRRTARAMAMRCFWPPERRVPCGRKACGFAARESERESEREGEN